jgi:hypothetical protein
MVYSWAKSLRCHSETHCAFRYGKEVPDVDFVLQPGDRAKVCALKNAVDNLSPLEHLFPFEFIPMMTAGHPL